MVSVAHFSTPPQTGLIGKMTENANNKIPHYAENYKKEYLFIRGLNKEFKYFTKKMDSLNHGLFESKKVNRIKNIMKDFLRGQEKGKLKNISNFILPEYDVDKLNSINKKFVNFVMILIAMVILFIVIELEMKMVMLSILLMVNLILVL